MLGQWTWADEKVSGPFDPIRVPIKSGCLTVRQHARLDYTFVISFNPTLSVRPYARLIHSDLHIVHACRAARLRLERHRWSIFALHCLDITSHLFPSPLDS